MSSPFSASEDFLSPRAKYELYNFHRPLERKRAREALNAPRPRVVTLEGLDEENHLLLLESACYQASREGDRWECVRLSFEDYNPDSGTAESFLNDQLGRREARGGKVEKLREALSGLALGLKAELDISTAFAISVAVSGGLRFAELLEAAAPTFEPVRGYPAPGPERLRASVDILTAESGVMLYLPGSYPLPVPLRRWLINISKHNDRLLLAFANVEADGAAEMTLGAPVREHFVLAPLTLSELTEAVDERFGPNAFPSDFYDALLVQSKGIPWRLAEVMKRLMQAGALVGGGSGPWSLSQSEGSSSSVLAQFSSTFHEPVDRLLEAREPWDHLVAEFVYLGALFREYVPASLLCMHLRLEPTAADELISDVLRRFGPESDSPLLADAGYHPDMPGERILRFRNRIGRAVLLDSYSDEERAAAAGELLSTLDEAFSQLSQGIARLYYELSQHQAPDRRGWFGDELEWWVGREEALDLKATLVEGLVSGKYSGDDLCRIAENMFRSWPAYRLNAVLESIEEADCEMPVNSLPHYYDIRAYALLSLGRAEEAEAFSRAGLAAIRDDEAEPKVIFLSQLVWAARLRGDLEAAREYAEAEVEASLGLGALAAKALADFGQACADLDEREPAEEAFLEALRIRKRVYGEDDLETSQSYAELAAFYANSGRAEIALPYAEQAYAIRTTHTPGSTLVAAACTMLAPLLATAGDAGTAEARAKEAIQIYSTMYGPEHDATARAYHTLGAVRAFLGDMSGAVEPFREALRIREKVLPGDHFDLAEAYYSLGAVIEPADAGAAEKYYEQALSILAERGELGKPSSVRMLITLLELIRRSGDVTRALNRGDSVLNALKAEPRRGTNDLIYLERFLIGLRGEPDVLGGDADPAVTLSHEMSRDDVGVTVTAEDRKPDASGLPSSGVWSRLKGLLSSARRKH